LVILPEKTEIPPILIPETPALIRPLLLMPPEKLVTSPTAIPVPVLVSSAERVPVFVMPPEKAETRATSIAGEADDDMRPELTIPPEKLVGPGLMPAGVPTRMPAAAAEIVPALDMPPVNVGPVTAIPVAVALIWL
jgi:hypothetical protein